jgi:hypothetical protein
VVTRTTFLSATLIGLLALTGCANKRSQQSTARTNAPTYAPRANSQVYYQRSYQPGDAPPADLAWGDVYVDQQVYAQPVEQYPAEMLGYETMSSGEQVVVVTYVHTYVDPIETYPRVYWAGRWYYNVGGTFVFWDPYWNTWTYYWGPPAPLCIAWNYHYPWVAYSWGVGYYGAGWYWGGAGYYGWHAYGRPPSGWRPSHGPNGDPGGPTDGGRPSHSPNGDGGGGGGGGGDPMTGVEAGGTRPIAPPPTTGAGVVGDARDVAGPKPERATGPGKGAPVVGAKVDEKPGRAPVEPTTRVAAGAGDVKPPRAAGEPQRITPSKPPRAPVATTTPTRSNEFATPRQQPARARVPAVVQVHDEHGGTTVRPTYAPPTARRTPTATVTRKPTTIGTTTNPTRASTSTPARASTPSSSGPTYRTVTPTRSSSSSYSPSRSSSSGSSYSPSRSSGGSSYSPSRSSGGSSYSPSRSSGGSSYSPSRSSGGSSYSPSRSSGGSSFSPSRSSGGSSFSPSRSSGGGGGGFSPSRGGGGGGGGAPSRSSGGGGRR